MDQQKKLKFFLQIKFVFKKNMFLFLDDYYWSTISTRRV